MAKPTSQQEEYKVQSGEWLYKILSNKGYSATEIRSLIPTIMEDNPQIVDIDHLKAGQVLILPSPKHSSPTLSISQQDPLPQADLAANQRAYIINPGDRLWNILQRQEWPSSVTMQQRIEFFQQLNPEIIDINQLQVGQKVILPSGPPQAPADSPPSTAQQGSLQQDFQDEPSKDMKEAPAVVQTSSKQHPLPLKPRSNVDIIRSMLEHKTQDNSTLEREPRTGLPFVRSVLKQMNFNFVPGDEIIYPLPPSGWFHIQLLETPIVETPWGSKVLLCTTPKNSEWLDQAKALNIHICNLDSGWTINEVFTQLNKIFPKNFRLWAQDKELVLGRNGLSLSLKSPHMVIIEQATQKNIFMLWSRGAIEEPPLPQGLPEVLEPSKVKIIELDPFNELSRLPARPSGAILVNLATVPELMAALNLKHSQDFFNSPAPQTMHGLLETLKSKNLLRQSMIRAAWIRGGQRLIAVQVPAWTIAHGSNTIALLDRRFANEHLLSLFAHEGYTCFILAD